MGDNKKFVPRPANPKTSKKGSDNKKLSCSVKKAETLGECANEPFFPATMKVPVTLAEPTIQVCVEAEIVLEKRALEIKPGTRKIGTDLQSICVQTVRGRFHPQEH